MYFGAEIDLKACFLSFLANYVYKFCTKLDFMHEFESRACTTVVPYRVVTTEKFNGRFKFPAFLPFFIVDQLIAQREKQKQREKRDGEKET